MAGDGSVSVPSDGEPPATGSLSVLDLRAAYTAEGRKHFKSIRGRFENEHGRIEEEYYATAVSAAVLVVERTPRIFGRTRIFRWWPRKYKIKTAFDASQADVAFSEAVRSALTQARQSFPLLGKRVQRSMVLSLYTVIAYLFNTLDSGVRSKGPCCIAEESRIDEATKSANNELDKIRKGAYEASRRAALAWYLLGLPIGGLIAYGLIVTLGRVPFSIAQNNGGIVNDQLGVCLALGGIGAVVSVMSRVTRRQRVEVDVHQGRLITMVAGSFRTIIGAILGSILFVFVQGGLLPLEKPGAGKDEGLFFAGLAFLAGFSERWAQDSIVHSAPALGQRGRERPGDDDTGQSPVQPERPRIVNSAKNNGHAEPRQPASR